MEPTEMRHCLLLPMLASSYWAHFIKYLKGEPVAWNHKLCTSLPYQLPKCTVDMPCLSYCSSYSFFLFISFFPRGETWNSFTALTAASPLLCAWSPANDLKQWRQDLWKKVSCHISACYKDNSDQEKKGSWVRRRSSYIPAPVLTSGTEPAEICMIFLIDREAIILYRST